MFLIINVFHCTFKIVLEIPPCEDLEDWCKHEPECDHEDVRQSCPKLCETCPSMSNNSYMVLQFLVLLYNHFIAEKVYCHLKLLFQVDANGQRLVVEKKK